MKALTDEESDAMEMKFPVYVHGMLKTGSLRRHDPARQGLGASSTFNVPHERRAEQSRLEVRYSPTLAGAMVDALPYLVDYPYGCTEQTLNRFLPTVITQKIAARDEARPEGDPARSAPTSTPRKSATTPSGPRAGSGSIATRSSTRPKLARDGQGGRQRLHRDAALRRRLGLVQRLGRASLAAHHGGRRARPADRQAERRRPRARRARARRRVAQALSGPSRLAAAQERRRKQATRQP